MSLAGYIATVDAAIRLVFWLALVGRASFALIHAADDPATCRDVVRSIRKRTTGWNIVGWLGVLTGIATLTSGRVSGASSDTLLYDAAATLLVGVLVGLVAWPALRVDGRRDDPAPEPEEVPA